MERMESVQALGKMMVEWVKSDAEKFCYVISGRVQCSIGQEMHALGTGDAIYFANGQPPR